MDPLRIHLFGGFLLERGGVALPPIASRAGRTLFAYLAMNPGRPIHRDLLAGVFWPDLTEGRARRRLSHTLWQVQDVVNTTETAHISATNDTVTFDTGAPYWLDVDEFDTCYSVAFGSANSSRDDMGRRATALSRCVELYGGDFLAGTFDDWVVLEQEFYRHRYLTSLTRLIEVTKSGGDYEEALILARRLTHHDPLNEEAHREVMRLSYLLGRTADAVEQYQRIQSVLEDELNEEPSSATTQLYERILRERRSGFSPRQGSDPPFLSVRSESPFVGRESERRQLIDAVERVLAGAGGVVFIEGEPGVGKTRLATELADDARWRGFEISWGVCSQGVLRPFAPIVGILESLTSLRLEQMAELVSPLSFTHALRLAPGLAEALGADVVLPPLRPTEELTRSRDALVNTLTALGHIAPHLLVVDDLQWADHDTLSVLSQLGSQLSDSRILIVVVFRSEEARGAPEVWDVIRELDRDSGLGRAVLSPLSVFELEEMVRRILNVPRLQPALASRLHRETGGNALFTLETLFSLRDRGFFEEERDPLVVLDKQIAGTGSLVGDRVRGIIESRISLLGDEALEMYRLASVIGDPVSLDLLEETSELPKAKVLAAVDELLYRGLLRTGERAATYKLAHDQIRQVVYESVGADTRRELHLRIAETLLSHDPDSVEAIGHHFYESGEVDTAATYLSESGRRAIQVSAYASARTFYEMARQASAQVGWHDDARFELLAQLETVLGVLGSAADQHAVLVEMESLVGTSAHLAGDLARRRAWSLASSGSLVEAEATALRAVEIEGESPSTSSGLAASLIALGTIKRWSGRPLDALDDLRSASTLTAGEPTLRAQALTELASTLVEVQQTDEAMAALDGALEIYRQTADLRGQAEAGGIRARALYQIGEAAEAGDQYELTIELCRRIGYRHGEGVNLTNLANLEQLHGRVADAIVHYGEAAHLFAQLGNRRGEAMVLANSASARHYILGDGDTALRDAERALGLFGEIGDHPREGQCLEIIAGVHQRSGNVGEARRLLEESIEKVSGSGNILLEVQHLRSLVELEMSVDDHDRASKLLDRATTLAKEGGLNELTTELLSLRGILEVALGDAQAGYISTAEAVDRLTAEAARPYVITHRHAVAARAAGDPITAREMALQSRETLHAALEGLDPQAMSRALEFVEEHKAIEELADFYTPKTTLVSLPISDAPVGKPLDPELLRTVEWTLYHPDDELALSPLERRRLKLARLVWESTLAGTEPTAKILAEILEVSSATIRRDLAALREKGQEVWTRGQRRKSG